MLPYEIDDPIDEPLTGAVEVTIDFGGGRKRWCFFVGDFVDGTQVRVHLGVPHMIVVSELNEQIIDRVLRQLHAAGQLKDHTASVV
jgi:hypothetical protein